MWNPWGGEMAWGHTQLQTVMHTIASGSTAAANFLHASYNDVIWSWSNWSIRGWCFLIQMKKNKQDNRQARLTLNNLNDTEIKTREGTREPEGMRAGRRAKTIDKFEGRVA